ncbi:hypothetical protein D5282_09505 [bacterium 1xD8-48]|jgi:hypothetical protein|nr:hypothetical protein [bacterium 1xD8-48]
MDFLPAVSGLYDTYFIIENSILQIRFIQDKDETASRNCRCFVNLRKFSLKSLKLLFWKNLLTSIKPGKDSQIGEGDIQKRDLYRERKKGSYPQKGISKQ